LAELTFGILLDASNSRAVLNTACESGLRTLDCAVRNVRHNPGAALVIVNRHAIAARPPEMLSRVREREHLRLREEPDAGHVLCHCFYCGMIIRGLREERLRNRHDIARSRNSPNVPLPCAPRRSRRRSR